MPGSVVRLKDIAARTGFSVNTVSLALRDSERIPDETRKRIRAAAAELDYLPNFVAKSLVNRETKTIGLVLTDVTNPVLTRVAQAVERLLAERGYGTLLGASNGDGGEESRVLEMFRSRQVDGMLVYPHSHRALDAVRRLRDAGLPVVLLAGDRGLRPRRGRDRRAPRRGQGGPAPDRARAPADRACSTALGRAATARSARAMSRRSPRPASPSTRRSCSTRAAARSAHGCVACARLLALPERPTALFADNDSLALGALRACQLAGAAVPDDLAIVGFDNIEFAEYATTPLTRSSGSSRPCRAASSTIARKSPACSRPSPVIALSSYVASPSICHGGRNRFGNAIRRPAEDRCGRRAPTLPIDRGARCA